MVSISALYNHIIRSQFHSALRLRSTPTHLSCLELADRFNCNTQQICILVDSGYYYDFVSGEVIRREAGPVVMGSILGWLLSGPVAIMILMNSLALLLCKV